MFSVNEKGTLAEAKITVDLIFKGYNVFKPISDFSPIDLIASDKKGKLIRFQIKYRTIEEREKNRITIQLSSVVNGKRIDIDKSLIDAYALYNPDFDKIFYIPISSFPTKSKKFLLEEEEKSKLSVLTRDFCNPEILW